MNSRNIIPLNKLIEQYKKSGLSYKLPVILGEDEEGKPQFADLDDLKHILIAGSTGSGKSVFLEAIISTFMNLFSPSELRFILIDMKRVEFSVHNGNPYVLGDCLSESNKVVAALDLLIDEKEKRLNLKKTKVNFPYIVVILDTFSDLMAACPQKFEQQIVNLTKDSKDSKIHIIMCDSRPSIDVFTEPIKNSFPTKIAGNTSSHFDSIWVLGTKGAEKLIGQGDMLFLPPYLKEPVRIQAPWISEEEINTLLKEYKKRD